MEALHDDHRVLAELHLMSMPLPAACFEIEAGQLHFLTLQKLRHILPEKVAVQGVDMFQVDFPVGARGDLVPVDIIVIQAHENGLLAMDPQLGCQPVCRGGLSGGGWARQHDSSCTPLADHIRHLGIALFMEGFVDPDQLTDPAGSSQFIQVRHHFALHQLAPFFALGKDREEIGHGGHLGKLIGLFIVRVHQDEAPVSGQQIPHRHIARIRSHFTVVIIGKITMGIDIKVIHIPPSEQTGLVGLSFGGIMGHSLFQADPAADQRDMLRNDLLHPGLQCGNGEILRTGDLHIDAGAQSTADLGCGLGPQLPDGQEDDELGSPLIHFPARGICIAKQVYLTAGGLHGSADRGTILNVLFPEGNIIQRKHLTGNFRR